MAMKDTTTYGWLMKVGPDRRRRVERLGWRRLANLFLAATAGSSVRRAICAEARRCGYTPSTIIALHAD